MLSRNLPAAGEVEGVERAVIAAVNRCATKIDYKNIPWWLLPVLGFYRRHFGCDLLTFFHASDHYQTAASS